MSVRQTDKQIRKFTNQQLLLLLLLLLFTVKQNGNDEMRKKEIRSSMQYKPLVGEIMRACDRGGSGYEVFLSPHPYSDSLLASRLQQ